MLRKIRVCLLAIALAATPACASLEHEGRTQRAPVVLTLEQRAYALLAVYAVALEQAAHVASHPGTPPELKRAIAEVERNATPAAEALHAGVAAYLRARDAASAQSLIAAIAAAEPRIAAFETTVRSGR